MNPPRTKRCRTCRTRKYLSAFYARAVLRGGYEHECKACVHKRKARTGPVRRCTDCGRRVRRFLRCSQCRETRQHEAEHAPQTPGPGVCGLPTRSGPCLSAVQDSADRMGNGTLYCAIHGERLAPVTRPKNFARYDQRTRMEAALEGFIERAHKPAEPNAAKRSAGRTAMTIQKAGNFTVIGRDRQREIHAA